MAKAGDFFARAFEQQCRATIAQKLNETSAFKKALAGIASVQDAQAKGFAPNDAQIRMVAGCIREAADAAYGLSYFCGLAASEAASQLVEAIAPQVRQLNAQWKQAGQFAFDAADLASMMQEAQASVQHHHHTLVKDLA